MSTGEKEGRRLKRWNGCAFLPGDLSRGNEERRLLISLLRGLRRLSKALREARQLIGGQTAATKSQPGAQARPSGDHGAHHPGPVHQEPDGAHPPVEAADPSPGDTWPFTSRSSFRPARGGSLGPHRVVPKVLPSRGAQDLDSVCKDCRINWGQISPRWDPAQIRGRLSPTLQ